MCVCIERSEVQFNLAIDFMGVSNKIIYRVLPSVYVTVSLKACKDSEL